MPNRLTGNKDDKNLPCVSEGPRCKPAANQHFVAKFFLWTYPLTKFYTWVVFANLAYKYT